MKHILTLIIATLLFTPSAHAGWFSKGPDLLIEAKDKITTLETQLTAQTITMNRWQIATGSLAVGCAFLLIIGTALGAKTRKQYHESQSTRRMGGTAASPSLNGRKPHLGQTAEENVHTTLAA